MDMKIAQAIDDHKDGGGQGWQEWKDDDAKGSEIVMIRYTIRITTWEKRYTKNVMERYTNHILFILITAIVFLA